MIKRCSHTCLLSAHVGSFWVGLGLLKLWNWQDFGALCKLQGSSLAALLLKSQEAESSGV